MANLHGAQTAMPSGGGSMRAPSFGNFGSMVPQPPNYASSMPPHSSPFTPGFPSGIALEINNLSTLKFFLIILDNITFKVHYK